MTFDTLSSDQIQALLDEQTAAYQTLKDSGLSLDLTRGKPSPAQLDLSNELLSMPGPDFKDAGGTDTRCYHETATRGSPTRPSPATRRHLGRTS